MKIDYTPAIRAFCEARIKQLQGHYEAQARIEELELIINLCDGLMAQAELLKNLDLSPK